MGQFYSSCSVSNQTIYGGDRAVMFLLLPQKEVNEVKNSQSLFKLFSWGFSGNYNNYGSLDFNIEEVENFDYFLKHTYKKNSSLGVENFLETLWDGHIKVKKDNQNIPVYLTLLHEAVYKEILLIGNNYQYSLKNDIHQNSTIRKNFDEKETILFDMINDIVQKYTPEKTKVIVKKTFELKSVNSYLSNEVEIIDKSFKKLFEEEIDFTDKQKEAIFFFNNILFGENKVIHNRKLIENNINEAIVSLIDKKNKIVFKNLITNIRKNQSFLIGLDLIKRIITPQMNAGQNFQGQEELMWQMKVLQRSHERNLARLKMIGQETNYKEIFSESFEKTFLDTYKSNPKKQPNKKGVL